MQYSLSKQLAAGVILTVGECTTPEEAATAMAAGLQADYSEVVNAPKKRASRAKKDEAPAEPAPQAPTTVPEGNAPETLPVSVTEPTPQAIPQPPAASTPPPPPTPPVAADPERASWTTAVEKIIVDVRTSWGETHYATIDVKITESCIAAGLVDAGATPAQCGSAMATANATQLKGFYDAFNASLQA